MFIARWNIDVRFGQKDQFLAVMRKWQAEVGDKIGWTKPKIRLLTGSIGANESRFEYEVTVESMEKLEKAWAQLGNFPYHKQFGKELEPLIVSGSNHWTVYRVLEL